MSDIAFRSATELAAMIAKNDISARELLDLYLDRIDRYNEALNAVVVDVRKEARETADKMDANPRNVAFHGVPMTVKESYDIPGAPTTWSCMVWS